MTPQALVNSCWWLSVPVSRVFLGGRARGAAAGVDRDEQVPRRQQAGAAGGALLQVRRLAGGAARVEAAYRAQLPGARSGRQ